MGCPPGFFWNRRWDLSPILAGNYLWSYLDQNALLIVTYGLITNPIDCFNMLYMGLPLKITWKLQLVENTAGKLLITLSSVSINTILVANRLHSLFKSTNHYLSNRQHLACPVQTPRRGLLKVPPPNRFPEMQIKQYISLMMAPVYKIF